VRWLCGIRRIPWTLFAENAMTRLDKPLRREVIIEERAYTLTLDPEGLRLAEKGHRRGIHLRWKDLVNGDAAIAAALNARPG
jgi:hypothetical protein